MAHNTVNPPAQPNKELQKQFIDTIVGAPEGGFSKPLTYCMMKSGLFEVRRTPVAIVSTRIGTPTNIPTIDQDIKEGVFSTVPKIPWPLMAQILSFFREVHKKHNTEVYASVWLDPTTKTYSVHVPEQRVSGASVHHDQKHDQAGELIHVLDIHSHNTMAAFFSGVDDSDEQKADRFYGVVGKLDNPIPMWKWRTRCAGKFIDIPAGMVVEGVEHETTVKVNLLDAISSVGVDQQNRTTGGKVTFETTVTVPDVAFPPEWMDQVKTGGGTVVQFPFRDKRTGGNSMDTTGGTKYPFHMSKKDRRKGVVYVYQGGNCYRQFPDGRQEPIMSWPVGTRR